MTFAGPQDVNEGTERGGAGSPMPQGGREGCRSREKDGGGRRFRSSLLGLLLTGS